MKLYQNLRLRLLREIYRLTNLPQSPSVQMKLRQQQQILANIEAVFEQFRREVVATKLFFAGWQARQTGWKIFSLRQYSKVNFFGLALKHKKRAFTALLHTV